LNYHCPRGYQATGMAEKQGCVAIPVKLTYRFDGREDQRKKGGVLAERIVGSPISQARQLHLKPIRRGGGRLEEQWAKRLVLGRKKGSEGKELIMSVFENYSPPGEKGT